MGMGGLGDSVITLSPYRPITPFPTLAYFLKALRLCQSCE